MIILDTSVWIAFFKREANIFSTVRSILEDGEVLAVECVFGELLQGAKSTRERDVIISYWNYLAKADVENIWIEAGKHSGEQRLISKGVGLIDAVIIVSAIRSNAKVWTLDRKLLGVLSRELVFAS